jgi:hypothetical protein
MIKGLDVSFVGGLRGRGVIHWRLNLPRPLIQSTLPAAAFSAFNSVIGTLKKGGYDVLEKLTRLIASAASQEIAPANIT